VIFVAILSHLCGGEPDKKIPRQLLTILSHLCGGELEINC
jgi:hypothetical protein